MYIFLIDYYLHIYAIDPIPFPSSVSVPLLDEDRGPQGRRWCLDWVS